MCVPDRPGNRLLLELYVTRDVEGGRKGREGRGEREREREREGERGRKGEREGGREGGREGENLFTMCTYNYTGTYVRIYLK